MINHARTLLINRAGKNSLPGTVGEEYTPPDYIPVALSSSVLFPHRILFGVAPDNVFLNFRAQELMSLIHATELAEYVYALDPRVTYWPKNGSEFFQLPTAAVTQKVSGYRRARIYLTGKHTADNINGKVFGDYSIRIVLDEENKMYAAMTAAGDTAAKIQELTYETETSNFSDPIRLPGSGLSARFSDIVEDSYSSLMLEEFNQSLLTQDYNSIELEPGTPLEFMAPRMYTALAPTDVVLVQWGVQAYARPDDAIKVCLPKLELLGEPLFLSLFGARNDIEPYATFKNIWFDHPMPNYRLAAFVLAMIYRTNELRR